MESVPLENLYAPEQTQYGSLAFDKESTNLFSPGPEYCISRDKSGNVKSEFAHNEWDVEAYKSSPKSPKKFKFLRARLCDDALSDELLYQQKRLHIILWNVAGNRNGVRATNATMAGYMTALNSLVSFAEINAVDIHTILHTDRLVEIWLCNAHPSIISKAKSILICLNKVSVSCLGFKPISQIKNKKLKKARQSLIVNYKQHPVIPVKILLDKLCNYKKTIDDFIKHQDKIFLFIDKISANPSYARGKTQQFYHPQYSVNNRYFPDFLEAVQECQIEEIITKYDINGVHNLSKFMGLVQYCAKNTIHMYSGMRDSEPYSLTQNCLQIIEKKHGIVRRIIGYTSKMTGIPSEQKWITSPDIENPVLVLKAISNKIAELNGWCITDDLPLFVSTSHFPFSNGYNRFHSETNGTPTISNLFSASYENLLPSTFITKSDFEELSLVDPYRDWESEEKFEIGREWPLTIHQFRRSLAVYAANSGLISLPSLKLMLKHITNQMSIYYANGSHEARGLFEFRKDHIANEYNDVKPFANSLAYIKNVILSDEILFGAHGIFVERNVRSGPDIIIATDRERIYKDFKNGLMFYQEGPLGGCMESGECKARAHVVLTHCAGCRSSVIKLSKVIEAISIKTVQLESLEKNTVGYYTEKAELDHLANLRHELESKK